MRGARVAVGLALLGAPSCAVLGFDLDGYEAADAGASGGASATSGSGGGASHGSSATASSGTHRPATSSASAASGPSSTTGTGGGSDGGGTPCNAGGFCFAPPVLTTLGGGAPSSLVAADLAGDGSAQILVGFASIASIGVVVSPATHGSVSMATTVAPATGLSLDVFGATTSQLLYAADSDGYIELADVTPPMGPPTLIQELSASVGVSGPRRVAALDGATGVPRVAVAYANGLDVIGGPTAKVTLGTTMPSALVSGDLDLDGFDDVVVGEPDHARIAILTQASTQASFTTHYVNLSGCKPRALALGDLDLDGAPEIVVGCEEGSVIVVSHTSGTWTKVETVAWQGSSIVSVAVADLDDDGLPDVVAVDSTTGLVRVLRGGGDGSLTAVSDLGPLGAPVAVVASDLDGDGLADVAVVDAQSLQVFVQL